MGIGFPPDEEAQQSVMRVVVSLPVVSVSVSLTVCGLLMVGAECVRPLLSPHDH